MSAATLEQPLPDLATSFGDALKAAEEKQAAPAKEQTKEPAKEAVKEPAAKEAVKEPDAKAKEPTKEAAPAKKKSALDAAISDEPPVVAEPEPDEVAKLIESTDPNWDKARETMKRQSEELKTYKEKLAKPELPADVAAELKASKELKDKLAKLTEENAKMRDSIVALDVRFDPAVQEKIQGRDKQAMSLADRVEAAGGKKDAFLAAMELPLSKRGKAIDAALEGIESGRELTTINTKLAQIEVVDEQLEEQLSKPHQSFEEIKQQREIAAREHAEQSERFKQSTFDRVQKDLPKLSKLMRPAPIDSEGADTYNADLRADLERAPSLLDVPAEEAAALAFKAARYDTVEKLFIERSTKDAARISELEDALAKLEGAQPGFRGGGKPKPKADFERPIADVFQEALSGGS